MPVAAGWYAKYPVREDSEVDKALGDDGGDNGGLLAWLSRTRLEFAVEVECWVCWVVACDFSEAAFTADDDESVVFAKDANWPVPSECVPCLLPGVS